MLLCKAKSQYLITCQIEHLLVFDIARQYTHVFYNVCRDVLRVVKMVTKLFSNDVHECLEMNVTPKVQGTLTQCWFDIRPLSATGTDFCRGGRHGNEPSRINVVLMLVHRLRRSPNIKTTLFQCIVFSGEADHSLVKWPSLSHVLAPLTN